MRRLLLVIAILLLAGAAVWYLAIRNAPLEPPLELPRIDRIVVDKSERRMDLYAGGRLVHTMADVQLGDAPVGHKQFEGDEKTPEGRYTIDGRNPRSSYHLSLRISYPAAPDRAFAAARQRSPGGDIFIHGQPNGMQRARMPGDWTDGCIAVSNREIEALWRAVPVGTPIEILP